MKKTPEEIWAEQRKTFTSFVTELNGIVEKAPEALRPGFKKLYDSANEFLSNLGPMEQSQAAPSAAWAFESLAHSLQRFQEMTGGLFAQVKAALENGNSLTLELNSLKDASKNVVLSKADHEAALEKARQEGRQAALPEVISSRKLVVEQCGLPCPTRLLEGKSVADDAVFALAATEYNSLFAQAKANLASLKEKGMALGGKGDAFIRRHVWLTKTEFDGSMDLIKDVLAPAASAAAPGGAAGEPRTAPDPMLGAPGDTARKAVPKTRIPI